MASWRSKEVQASPGPAGADASRPRRGPLGFFRRRREASNRKEFVAQLDEVWGRTYVRPFRAWFDASVPVNDYTGPGGLRFAADAVWTLATFRTEMHAWMDLELGPPDEEALRSVITVARRDFEILHRNLQERFPQNVPPLAVSAVADMPAFWAAFKRAAARFEAGQSDGDDRVTAASELDWVTGLVEMMQLAMSWSGAYAASASR